MIALLIIGLLPLMFTLLPRILLHSLFLPRILLFIPPPLLFPSLLPLSPLLPLLPLLQCISTDDG